MSPELRLVRAIIAQAVQDAFASTGSDSTHDTDAENRKAAIAFLTAPDGAHARHRNDLCELAGFDGTRLRKRVIAVLEGEDLANLFDDTRRNKDFLARARAIWAAREPLVAPTPRVPRAPVKPPAPEPDVRTDILAAIKRMLKHGPATSRELSDAMGNAISARAVTAYLNRNPDFERDGDFWKLAARAAA